MDNRLFLLMDENDIKNLITESCNDENTDIGKILEKIVSNKGFPFYEYFLKNTQFGEDVEKLLSERIYRNLRRVKGDNFDLVTEDGERKVEVKAIRMMTNIDKGEKFPIQRAISIFDELNHLSNTSLQQIKPAEFDEMLGVLLYKDGIQIYQVPSQVFHPVVLPKRDPKYKNQIKELRSEGKIVLSGQHKDNLTEGQIGFKELSDYLRVSLYYKDGDFYYIQSGDKTETKLDKLYL